jgi:hypothetical protein
MKYVYRIILDFQNTLFKNDHFKKFHLNFNTTDCMLYQGMHTLLYIFVI